MSYQWHLRLRMAEKGMYATTDLVPLLAERGVHLSREQVFRLVTQLPQRLSVDTLATLCDILDCKPNDLIQIEAAQPGTVVKWSKITKRDRASYLTARDPTASRQGAAC
jgi:DNA-binding Xre family transcriptional regulator